jgi:hypothetical protein
MSLIALMHLCIRNVNVYVWLDSIQTRIRACMRRVAVLRDSMVSMQKMMLGDFFAVAYSGMRRLSSNG